MELPDYLNLDDSVSALIFHLWGIRFSCRSQGTRKLFLNFVPIFTHQKTAITVWFNLPDLAISLNFNLGFSGERLLQPYAKAQTNSQMLMHLLRSRLWAEYSPVTSPVSVLRLLPIHVSQDEGSAMSHPQHSNSWRSHCACKQEQCIHSMLQ